MPRKYTEFCHTHENSAECYIIRMRPFCCSHSVPGYMLGNKLSAPVRKEISFICSSLDC